jgi:hypothetical protein
MTRFIQYDPVAPQSKKCIRRSATLPDNPTKRLRVSSVSDTMTATPVTRELVDIRARLDPSARMDLALKVLDIGHLSVTKLLMHWLGSGHFKTAFLSEGGGLEVLLEELVDQYPVAEDCISRAVGYETMCKTVSAEMERVKSHALLSSTEVTPHSMRDWTVGIPEELAPCLSSILRASAVSQRSEKENKVKKDTFTVSTALLVYDGERNVN